MLFRLYIMVIIKKSYLDNPADLKIDLFGWLNTSIALIKKVDHILDFLNLKKFNHNIWSKKSDILTKSWSSLRSGLKSSLKVRS